MTTTAHILAFVSAVGVACSHSPDSTPIPPASHPAAPSHSGPLAAAEQLDRMDRRAPVPLLPAMASHQKENMRDHLIAVQQVVTAISIADYAGVEAAAARIGFSQMMGQMCTHLGSGAPGFAEQAIEFHHTADRIGAAARERNVEGVSPLSGQPCRRVRRAMRSGNSRSSMNQPGSDSHPRSALPGLTRRSPTVLSRARLGEFGPRMVTQRFRGAISTPAG